MSLPRPPYFQSRLCGECVQMHELTALAGCSKSHPRPETCANSPTNARCFFKNTFFNTTLELNYHAWLHRAPSHHTP